MDDLTLKNAAASTSAAAIARAPVDMFRRVTFASIKLTVYFSIKLTMYFSISLTM